MVKFFGSKQELRKNTNARIVYVILFFGILTLLSSNNVLATSYSATLTTGGDITLSGNGYGDGVSIESDDLNVATNCRAGYNLSLSTSTANNNLYLDGDSSVSGEDSYFTPTDGASGLASTTNHWGYLLSSSVPSSSSVFSTVPGSLVEPALIKTTHETASESDINDSFSVYYGVSMSNTITSGTYKMVKDGNNQDGSIVYSLTMSPSCADSTVVTFNEDLDGAGAEGTDASIANFPSTNDNTIDTANQTITLSNKRPTRSGYIFKEWNTEADGTGDYYYVGETIPMGQGGLSGFVTLYAIWVPNCSADTICYNDNHADGGIMTNQTATSNTNNILIPGNFNRSDYGFAGWNTEADGTGTNYGPNQTINPGDLSTTGLTLFAHWIKSSDTLQTWDGASNMNIGDVIALKDNRDNEVYTIAKLADNNVWIIENLRLVPNSVTFTTKNTNSPTTGFISAAPSSSSTTTQCSTDDSTCNDQVYFYAGNMDRTKAQEPTGNDSSKAWYSYGTMYNWFTATAGNGTNSKSSGSVTGDICPSGWRLPTGGRSGEYSALSTTLGGTGSAGATALRSYPNNFIHSGDYNPSTNIPDGRGTQGRIWTSTAQSAAKSYRMGYNNTSITPAGTWNKWDNFAVRCIYQGGNIHYSEVTINFAGSGITSVTFESNNHDTETATPASPTVSLAENTSYTITATTNVGYELSSWATTSGGALANTSTNPTTYTITGEATLTATGAEVPSFTTTINMGEHITGISFTNTTYGTESLTPASASCTSNNNNTYTCTISLRRSVEYTLSSSFEAGYTIDTWTTTINGTLGDATSASTTYAITGPATLSISAQEASEVSYTLIYNAGDGTDAPGSDTATSYDSSYNFTITNSAPINYGYTFTGWSETNGGSTIDYASGDTITITSTGTETTKTLYAVYTANSCPASRICYYDNGADVNGGGRNTMANQSASSNSSATLIPSNYSKSGYGFAGWATDANATPYGPNATITTPDISSTGLALYAKWVAPTGALQSWNGCNTLTQNSVIALTDTRDDNVYAVAKLADDNCWTIESLRLVPNTATITSQNTHNPASGFAAAAANSSSSNALCNTDDDSSCINQLQYNTNSLNRNLTQSYNGTGDNVAWYSYGVYYNWYTATAGQGTFSTSANTNVSGDLCPKNWHLPTSTSSGEWAALNTAVNGGVSNADAGLRTYPVNLIWSGDYNGSSRTSGYSNGRYWSSTGLDANNAYRMGHQESGSKGSTPSGNYRKWDGFAIRCVRDEGTIEYSDVVVTFPANVTSVSFTSAQHGIETATPSNSTVTLVQGATYTLTATFASGYTLDSWINGTNSTIGSASALPTTFSITDNSTLTLTTKEICGVTVGPNAICYEANGNDVVGTMGAQTFSSADTSITLLASNFSRTGYGFAGWSTDSTVTNNSKIYGPQEDLTFTAGQYSTTGLKLYAVWIQSAGSMQSDYWNVCKTLTAAPTNGTANINSVSALTDQRDNNTYAIAKLADGKCWMIENLRLESTAEHNSEGTLAQGYGTSATYGNFGGLANAESSNFIDSTTANSLYYSGTQSGTASIDIGTTNRPGYRMPRYNNINTSTRATNPTNNDGNMYSYGNYYTWHAAIADLTYNGTNNQSSTGTSLCPAGWHLPTGGMAYASGSSSGVNVTGDTSTFREFYNLGYKIMDEAKTAYEDTPNSGNAGYTTDTTNTTGKTATTAFRSFPNNFLYSGYFGTSSAAIRGSYGSYWSSTADDNIGSYGLYLSSSNVYPGTGYNTKNGGRSIRCTISAPAHSVTISPDSHISSVTFSASGETTQTATSASPTVSLKEGKSYTITATTDTGYEFASWSTTANGTLGSTTTNPTTYTITDTATLTVASQEVCSGTIAANSICYAPNGNNVEGTMGIQAFSSTDTSVTLLASNFSRTGYGFAGWSPDSTITSNSKIYGPQEDLAMTANQYSTTGLKLYAVWVQSAGSLQSDAWNTCKTLTTAPTDGTANLSSVSALTDQRDNETYAIAKLADGKCWMIENLRLDNSATLTTINTNNPLNDGTNVTLKHSYSDTETHNTLSASQDPTTTAWCTTNAASCDDQSMLFTGNTTNRATNPTTSSGNTYSYGNYYNWYSATAGNGTYSFSTNNNSVAGDLCPTGWHLPIGGRKANVDVSDFWKLSRATIGADPANFANDYFYYTGTPEGTDASNKMRAYPNNFVYSGYVNGGSVSNRGSNGYFWSSTAYSSVNAYNLNLYSSSVDPGTITYNKYRGRTVRCVAPAPTHSVTISPDSHISSVTFSATGETTQTATSANPTVSLKEGKSYTITATTDTSYEFASWSTTANGTLGSTTTNPTTYTITDTATLTITSQAIPTYTITVNMDSNITGITFANTDYGSQSVTTTGSTVTLRRGVPYTITATTATGYEFASWSTTANGTLGSTTTNPTTYTITDTATLTVASQELCSGTVAANSICYIPNGNNVEGTMGVQTFSSTDTSVTLLASNFSRTGYGFAGWSTDSTITNNSKIYGPQEDLTFTAGQYNTAGIKLYAVWVQSAGYLQTDTATTCRNLIAAPIDGSANLSSVSALTDQRDNETYAIAKLADGNCWMIENLRLESTNSDNSTGALAQGYRTSTTYGNFSGLADAESTSISGTYSANSLYSSDGSNGTIGIASYNAAYRMPRYNNWNHQASSANRPQYPTTNYVKNSNTNAGMYSYGNYYTWHAAIADTTHYDSGDHGTTSLCPRGWRLPIGDQSTANKSFGNLSVSLGGPEGGATANSSSTPTGTVMSTRFRSFPNNYLYSGIDNPTDFIGTAGGYWSSTTISAYRSYAMALDNSRVFLGKLEKEKWYSLGVRCIADISN